MHNLYSQPASLDLLPFVRAFSQREMIDLPEPVSQPLPARLEQTLEFQFGASFHVANATRRENVSPITLVGSYWDGGLVAQFAGKIISFGIFFQPVGLSRLLHIPPAEFANRCLNARDVLPAEMGRLHQQLAAVSSFPTRVVIAEQYLRAKAARAQSCNGDVGCDAATRIFCANGVLKMRDVAAEYGLSLRHFERRVKHTMGVSAKAFSRVARFQTALDTKLLQPHRSWLSVAHELGYHDQMHMIHDFHDLAGAAPTEILQTIRDARPPAMQNFSQF